MKVSTLKAEALARIIAYAIGMLLAHAAFGQVWVEERTFVRDGQAIARIDGLVSQSLAGKLGGFVWFQTEKGYSKTYGQIYGGPTFLAKSYLQFGLGAGVEQAKNPGRLGGFVWIGDSKSSLLFVPEYGGSGFWWKLEANYKLGQSVGAGFITERFKGSGPRFEYKIIHTPFVVWAAPMFEKQRVNALFGLRWVFK